MGMFKRTLDVSEDPDGLIGWRTDRLHNGGFSAPLADTLARDRRYDVHALLQLTDRGCPAELAARILAPLEHEAGACR
jgi:hypothetical protein